MNNVFNVIDDPTAAGGYKTQQYANILQNLFAQQKAKEDADKAAAVGDWQTRTAGKSVYEAGQSAPVSSMDPRQAALYSGASPSPEDLNRAAVTKEQGRLINNPNPNSLDDYVGHERAVNKVNPDSAQIMMKAMSIYNQMPEGPAKEAFGIKYGLETSATTDAKLKSAEDLAKEKAQIEADRFAATEKDKEASREIARLAIGSGDKRASEALASANARHREDYIAARLKDGYTPEQITAMLGGTSLTTSGAPGADPPGKDDRVQKKLDQVLSDPTGASWHLIPEKTPVDKLLKSQLSDALLAAGYSIPNKSTTQDKDGLRSANSAAMGLATLKAITDKWQKKGVPLNGSITGRANAAFSSKQGGLGVGSMERLLGALNPTDIAEFKKDTATFNDLALMVAAAEAAAMGRGRPTKVMYDNIRETMPRLGMDDATLEGSFAAAKEKAMQAKQSILSGIWGAKVPPAALNYSELDPSILAQMKQVIAVRGSSITPAIAEHAASHFEKKYNTQQEQAISAKMARDNVSRQDAIAWLEGKP